MQTSVYFDFNYVSNEIDVNYSVSKSQSYYIIIVRNTIRLK